MSELSLHPDRLFPSGPEQREVARAIFAEIERLPIVSPHGHLDAGLFVSNEPFSDPAQLFVTSDHYVVRLLHAQGVALRDLGVGPPGTERRADGREVWRHLCSHWGALAGTPSRLWLEHELYDLCELRVAPSLETADESYDTLKSRLQEDDLRPRALYERFGLDVLTTTDPATDDLALHEALGNDPTWKGRLLPNFRPDDVVDPAHPGFSANLGRLAEVSGIDTGTYTGYITALESRREFFRRRGATAADHGVPVTTTERLQPAGASEVYARLQSGDGSPADVEAFQGHMLDEMARMAADDGMVMQLHVGVVRDYDLGYAATYGHDIGQDFPYAMEFTKTMRPLLSRYGNAEGFRLVLYTVDETTFSREIGPLVSYFPSLFAGPPWWFLDAPDAMARAFAALGETAGITKLTGFVDDTRSFFGIGARHDVARRVCAGYLARLVSEHRLSLEESMRLAVGYAYQRPKELFKV
jgi:glucuronate isomerase